MQLVYLDDKILLMKSNLKKIFAFQSGMLKQLLYQSLPALALPFTKSVKLFLLLYCHN